MVVHEVVVRPTRAAHVLLAAEERLRREAAQVLRVLGLGYGAAAATGAAGLRRSGGLGSDAQPRRRFGGVDAGPRQHLFMF